MDTRPVGTRRVKHVWLYAVLAAAAASGCMGFQRFAPLLESPHGPTSVPRMASVRLFPRVEPGRTIQAVVTPNTSSSIASFSVAAFVETETDTYKPIKASTGLPGEAGDSGLLEASFPVEDYFGESGVEFKNLKPSKNYRFLARAFGSSGDQISDDASSTVDLAVADDDRPTLGTIPVYLLDTPFSATASVTLSVGSITYDRIDTEFFEISGSSESAVAGATASVESPASGSVYTFSNLKAKTTYRLKGAAKSGSQTVATGSVDIAVSNDDQPASVTLSIGQDN